MNRDIILNKTQTIVRCNITENLSDFLEFADIILKLDNN
jgi:hypothetical protein